MDSLPWLNVTTVLPTPNECSECSDFEINKFIPTSPSDDYPTLVQSQSPETPHGRPVYSNIKLGAYTITFKNQGSAWEVARYNYSTGTWNIKNVTCYLKMCGINMADIEKIQSYTNTNVPPVQMLLPPILKHNIGFSEDIFVESIMHLLFEGVLKTILAKIVPTYLKKTIVSNKFMNQLIYFS
jgi:hypothetical protein